MRNVGKMMIAATAGALTLGLGACANSEQASSLPPGDPALTVAPRTTSVPPTTTVAPTTTAVAATTAAGPECTGKDVKVEGAPGSKPTITIPKTCAPPKVLLTLDLVPGNGPEIKAGSNASMHYDLVTWSDGKELDSSWSRNQPYDLENIGQAQVIDGWNEGLIGMKQGGRRLLLVPPDKGYGQGGNGVKPNETLVFVVDAVQVS
ncbi:FKBP-type peptidyl-prolyl cis-trans isomerase [Actinokineospora enzanensis]|uniref:FKBP-type peptidyl-prolyl cis-trans isomerase n=1 Tax=Actinokineospora enzanensis TaxID=155975 RepID=UPI00036818ED|nr:FKBP-type peptidyl-prolyl cis-trans isomerase [Actinokineospora enzanensis]